MSSVRARFTMCVVGSSAESKTNVWALRYMELLDDDFDHEVYEFPREYGELGHHDKLFALPAAVTACRKIPKRHTLRTFRVIMPPLVAAIYVDNDGNPIFRGDPLDVRVPDKPPADPVAPVVNTVSFPRPLSSVIKDAVISKFNPKLHNASSWLDIFERECRRLDVHEDRFWEIIRLFLEGAAEQWYNFIRNTNPHNILWDFWKNSFLKNFSKKGWSSAAAAFSYRYIAGSFIDYTHTKISMLSAYNPCMHKLDVMSHVVLGLPQYLQVRINPLDVDEIDDLVGIISSFEKPFIRKISDSKNPTASSSAFNSLRPRNITSPCLYCKFKGFERFHKESDCFTKFKDSRDKNNGNNNSNNNVKSNSKFPAIHTFDTASLEEAISRVQKND